MVGRADSDLVRRQNRHLLLESLRFEGPAPRVNLGTLTGLSPATITSITTQLLQEGILVEIDEANNKPDAGRRGRPAVSLALNPAAANILILKMSIDAFELALADYTGHVMARHTKSLSTFKMAADDVGPTAARVILDFLSVKGVHPGKIAKLGIAVQGAAHAASGTLSWSPAFRVRDVPLVEPITRITGIATTISNDANMIAEGLMARERYQFKGSAAVMFMGYGVGMGLVIDGKVYHGISGSAAEFGHMNHIPGGALCRCGRAGCLEAYASDYGILRSAEGLPDETPPPSTAVDSPVMTALATAARNGDPHARRAYDKAGLAIGFGLARLIALLNPDRIVIAGPGTRALDLMETAIDQGMEQGVASALRQKLQIEVIPLDRDMIITGTIEAQLRALDRDVFAIGESLLV